MKESVEEFTKRVLAEVRVDIDIDYCVKNGVKFKNHEIEPDEPVLFTKESNRKAYDFVMKNRTNKNK